MKKLGLQSNTSTELWKLSISHLNFARTKDLFPPRRVTALLTFSVPCLFPSLFFQIPVQSFERNTGLFFLCFYSKYTLQFFFFFFTLSFQENRQVCCRVKNTHLLWHLSIWWLSSRCRISRPLPIPAWFTVTEQGRCFLCVEGTIFISSWPVCTCSISHLIHHANLFPGLMWSGH